MGWTNQYFTTIIIEGNAPQTGLFIYQGAPAFQTLIVSATPTAGTDPFGNPFLAGLNAYINESGTIFAVSLNLPSGAGFAGLSVQDINNRPSQVPGFFAEANNTNNALAFMTSGAATGPDIAAFIQAYSQVQSAVAGGQIVLQAGDIQFNVNGNLADYQVTSTGSPVVTETTGDGVTYHIGHVAVRNNGVPQTISSTSFATILTSTNLLAAKGYHMVGQALYIGNQAAGAPIFSFGPSGGLILSTQQNGFQRFSGGGVAPIIHNNNGALGAVTGPLFAANTTNWLYEWDIYFNVNTGGQLLITAAENTAGDSFVINQCYAKIEEY